MTPSGRLFSTYSSLGRLTKAYESSHGAQSAQRVTSRFRSEAIAADELSKTPMVSLVSVSSAVRIA